MRRRQERVSSKRATRSSAWSRSCPTAMSRTNRPIRPGDRVIGYVMSAPGVHLDGFVESIGSAVAELDNLSIAGVPPIQRDLNWIRIAQRFPVRIALERPPEELMRIGASAVVVVHHDGR